MTLQKSQLNGQPRENWMLIEAYRLRSASSHSGTASGRMSAKSVGRVDVLRAALRQIVRGRRQRQLAFVQDEVIDDVFDTDPARG